MILILVLSNVTRRIFTKIGFLPCALFESRVSTRAIFRLRSILKSKVRLVPSFFFFFSFPLFLSAPLEITGAHASLLYRRVENGAISRMRCRLHSARRKPPSFLTRFLVENPIDRASQHLSISVSPHELNWKSVKKSKYRFQEGSFQKKEIRNEM